MGIVKSDISDHFPIFLMMRYRNTGKGASLALVGHPFSDIITIKLPYGEMFYYVDQFCTPSFPIGLVKTKSDFIVRPIETGFR